MYLRVSRGFTLIEVMVVLSIVAILALVGYPTYMEQIHKTARKQAIGEILHIASRVEQFHTHKLRYPSSDEEVAMFELTNDKYKIAVASDKDQHGIVGYKITATAVEGSTQSQDRCGDLAFDNKGVWTFSKDDVSEADCL